MLPLLPIRSQDPIDAPGWVRGQYWNLQCPDRLPSVSKRMFSERVKARDRSHPSLQTALQGTSHRPEPREAPRKGSGRLLGVALRRHCLPRLRGGGSSAAPAPGLVSDGPVRHSPQPELGQRTHLVALEAHQGNQHLIAVDIEDGGPAAAAWLRLSAASGQRLQRDGEHGRGNLVEHGELQISRLI
jgi:hypothetical protein